MKIVLIYPALTPGVRPRFGLQPLGILYLGAVLRALDMEVRLIDAEILGLTADEMLNEAIRGKPALVGISAMTPQYPVAMELARRIKQHSPETKVCLGGAHVNATGAEAIRLCRAIDFVVCGEGEHTIREVALSLGKAKSLSGIRGIIVRQNGTALRTPRRPFIENLDELPRPDFRMLPLDLYRIPYLRGHPIGSMMLSRGCPYRCSFCDAFVTQGKKLRKHSPGYILDWIAHCARDLGIRSFAFKDSTFTLDRGWCLELLNLIRSAKLGISYRCNTRVDRIDPELLEALKASGCNMILFGVESGSQAVLNRMNKAITVEQIREAFRLTSRCGIRTYASFMFGNLGETPETARETIELAKEINPDLVLFFFTTAYPGTELYREAVSENLVARNWWCQEQPFDEQYEFSKWLSGEGGKLKLKGFDTSAWLKKAYRSFYFRPSYFFKVLRRLLRDPFYIKCLLEIFPSLLSFSRSSKETSSLSQLNETAD